MYRNNPFVLEGVNEKMSDRLQNSDNGRTRRQPRQTAVDDRMGRRLRLERAL